jgi:DNA-binding HxlR family transcriptional regulator
MGFILQLRYSEGMGRKKTFGDFTCSIARTLDVVGDRWTLLVLRDVFVGINRFDEIQRDLGIARNVLAERLESLVRDGVLERRAYQERPPRHEYMLTQKGKDLQSVLLAMVAWGDRWQGAKEGPPVRLRHETCSTDTRAVIVCSSCGMPLSPGEVTARGGPGGRVGAGTQVIGELLAAGPRRLAVPGASQS